MAEEIKKVLTIEADTSQAEQALDGVKDKLEDVQEAAEKVDVVEQFANVTKVAAGVVGAFNSVKGAMTLLGVESENVEKAIQKMQAGMAMVQGFQAIAEGAKSFKTLLVGIKAATVGLKGFKKALIGTGIGAAIVLVGELVAHWDDLVKALGLAKISQEEFSKALKETPFAQANNDMATYLRSLGVAEEEIIRQQISHMRHLVNTYIQEEQRLIREAESREEWDFMKGVEDNWPRINAYLFQLASIQEGQDHFTAAQAEAQQWFSGLTEREKEYLDEYTQHMKALAEINNLIAQDAANVSSGPLDRLIEKAKYEIDDEIQLTEELITVERHRLGLYEEGTKKYYKQQNVISNLEDQLLEKKKASYDVELNLKKAQKEEGWEYTEAGYSYMMSYYNKVMGLYKTDDARYKNALADKLNYKKAYLKANEKEEEETLELLTTSRLDALDRQYVDELMELQKSSKNYADYIKDKEHLDDKYRL